jgi:hypothetical protein
LLDETKRNAQKGMLGIEGRKVTDGLEMFGTCIVSDLFQHKCHGKYAERQYDTRHDTPCSPLQVPHHPTP